MKTVQLLFTILISSFCIPLFAQEYTNFHFKRTQVDEGLSENTVYCILQDSKGFLWFGTKDGLNRYDGAGFRTFRNKVNDPGSLGNNFIRSIVQTNDETFYIGTDVGLYVMNPDNETFIRLNGETLSSAITSLYIDKQQNIWIGTLHQGIYYYNTQTRELRQVEVVRYNLDNTAIWNIYGDRSGTMWVGTRLGLLRYNSNIDKLEAVENLFSPLNTEHEVLTMLEDKKGNLWLGTWLNGIRCYNKQSYDNVTYLGLQDSSYYVTHVRALFQYTDNSLLVGSDDGLYLFDTDQLTSRRIDIPQSKSSLSDQNVYSIAQDKEGGIWIGTYFGGINYLNVSLQPIETYYSDISSGMLSGKAVSQFCEDKEGNMWIATEDGGVNYFNVKSKQITQPIKTSYHNTHALLLDGDNLWIGTFSRGIDIYNTRTHKLINLRNNAGDASSLNDDCVFSLYKTRSGDIYAGTPAGLNKYNQDTGTFQRIHEVNGFVYDMKEDDTGDLWIASYGKGVIRYNVSTASWINYSTILPPDNPVVDSKLTHVYIDSRKRLIFSSEGRGIFLYNHQTDSFTNISEADGLPNSVVYGVLDDIFGNLWLSCNKGIVNFDIENPAACRLYTKEDGLQSNQFNYKSCHKTRDGKFYFGGINGFNCFYPQDLTAIQNQVIPSVEITHLKLLSNTDPELETEIQTQINKKQKIVLPHTNSSFTISYVSLSYPSQLKNEYAYMLEGADNKWIYAGNNKNVTYVNLPQGNYLFKVKASNNSGVWNETGSCIEIEILPPFWWSLSARILYLLLFILFAYFLFSFYWNKNKEKQKRDLETFKAEQETLAFKSKIDFFTNIAHEIRTPVSLIKAPLEEVILLGEGGKETKQNLSIIERNCNRLNVLINQLLDFRKMDASQYVLNVERINLKEHISELCYRFRKTAQSNKIDFILNLPANEELFVVSDPDALTKIIDNLLTNAIKFTTDKINLTLEVDNNFYTVSVEDNGKGIPDDLKSIIFDPFYQIQPDNNKQGSGIGLSLVKNLAKMLEGKIEVKDGAMGGSLFRFVFTDISIPIEQASKEEKKTLVDTLPKETHNLHKNSILVVDDNPDITSFIKNCLQNEYQVDTALHATVAMKLLEEKNFDLIISDIMMPDIDGISFTKKIKADLNYSHIPVILLSAKTDNVVKVEGLRSGAEVFMEKPFSTSFLKAQIVSLLENRKTILEAFNRSPLASYATLVTNKSDETFLSKLNEEIEKHLSDETFSVESLTDILSISRSNLQRKLKGICGTTPGDYLRNYRLKHACKLLLEGEMRINEVAFYVGFNSASYFTKAFIKAYGMSPKEFIQKNK
ncbi:hybrid sensor histidine kinase/response regulator transcription factor [Bacteroides sp. 519]|uniref:hybrid sensor histidine kinase/response regulator transcription factor n=1 Tax=Bacteroides sp. 519 TaxID=2302937 RepID=UPI0013D0D81E|nr:hybrid sensor histidine kinase/response regulator transcription factor [Bacteroides sp. 519]NDV58256.1 hybrid sensor histidine kinase/response regulator [Bacteroides sp. 519]